jgi:hypothetical protein
VVRCLTGALGITRPTFGGRKARRGRRASIGKCGRESALLESAFAAADEADEDALAFEAVGDDVGEARVGSAEDSAAAFDDVAFERGGRAVDQGGDDVAGFGFTGFEEGEVAVHDVGVDHGVAADDEGPIFFARGKAEEGGIDGDGFEGLLFTQVSVTGGDGAVDVDFSEVRLDFAAFHAPGAMDELFDEAAFGEGAEVLDGGCLAGEAEVFGDLAGGGRHAFARLEFAQIIEDGFLFLGEHGGGGVRVNVRSAERWRNQARECEEAGNFLTRDGEEGGSGGDLIWNSGRLETERDGREQGRRWEENDFSKVPEFQIREPP